MNEFVPVDWNGQGGSIIKVIGVGGGGNNAVRNMYNKGIEGVDFVICNTDAQVLKKSPVPYKIQLGVDLTKGRGAGCDPNQGRLAAEENLHDIRVVLEDNTEMVFITAGMGGGTGTGAAPIIAKEAKSMGILTVAIVTLPFQDEGLEPFNRAMDGLDELRKNVDSLLIINNQKLYEIYPELSVFDAFPKADDIVATAAKGIAELITKEGYINVDFADVKKVMKDSGMALMGMGRASGPHRAVDAVELALNSPLLSDNDISGASDILVNISSGATNPLKMEELGQIMNYINTASGGKANFKRGVTLDESLGEDINVTIVATGFQMNILPELGDHFRRKNKDTKIILGDDDTEKIDLTDDNIGISIRTVDPVTNGKPLSQGQSGYSAATTVPAGQLKDSDITRMEETPAYMRMNINLNNSSVNEVSKHKLEEKDGGYKLSENNTFTDPNID